MKKRYIKPEMKVFQMKMCHQVLVGSPDPVRTHDVYSDQEEL